MQNHKQHLVISRGWASLAIWGCCRLASILKRSLRMCCRWTASGGDAERGRSAGSSIAAMHACCPSAPAHA